MSIHKIHNMIMTTRDGRLYYGSHALTPEQTALAMALNELPAHVLDELRPDLEAFLKGSISFDQFLWRRRIAPSVFQP